MAFRDAFSDKEWCTLQFAPLWVLMAVAGADGKIDKKEMKAFGDSLHQAPLFRSELAREVLFSLASDFDAALRAFHADGRKIDVGLGHVADILDQRVSAEIGILFKKALFGIGLQIAQASGGFLGFGNKVSQEERVALALVATWLRVPLNQLLT